MANNPYVNKVVYGNQTVIDLSSDTAVASDVAQGKTFHDATGALVTGTASGGGSAEKQTDFYPFATYGAIHQYGGVAIDKFKLSANDVENIDKITIKGKMWHYQGSSQQKYSYIGYLFLGEKDGKIYYYNGTTWQNTNSTLSTQTNITPVLLASLASNNQNLVTQEINSEISIKNIVASAKSSGVNLDFSSSFAIACPSLNGYSKTLNCDIYGKSCCFMLFRYCYRNPSSISALTSFGFSVANTTNADTPSTLASNPPQVKVEWKSDTPTPQPTGLYLYDEGESDFTFNNGMALDSRDSSPNAVIFGQNSIQVDVAQYQSYYFSTKQVVDFSLYENFYMTYECEGVEYTKSVSVSAISGQYYVGIQRWRYTGICLKYSSTETNNNYTIVSPNLMLSNDANVRKTVYIKKIWFE